VRWTAWGSRSVPPILIPDNKPKPAWLWRSATSEVSQMRVWCLPRCLPLDCAPATAALAWEWSRRGIRMLSPRNTLVTVRAVDRHLIAIAHAAEAGMECPPLRLLVGGVFIVGVPTSSQRFLEETTDPLAREYETNLNSRPRRERRANYIDPDELVAEHMGNVKWPREQGGRVRVPCS
jgi:hypothetical protein